MGRYTNIKVFYKDRFVGYAGLVDKAVKGMFIYSDEWREDGFAISPFALPESVQRRIYVTKDTHPSGMFSVFTESLPGPWGSFIQKKFLEQMGVAYSSLNVLDLLAMTGSRGRGALTYQPESFVDTDTERLSHDEFAAEILKMTHTGKSKVLGTLYMKGAITGGATPKIVETIDGEDWFVKFPMRKDLSEKGLMEYEYIACAKMCGIDTAETKLLESSECSGYVAVKCFDRKMEGNITEKIHMQTAAGMVEKDWRQPGYDYHELMKMALIVTRACREDIEDIFRRMCFNVFAHNCNDNLSKFSFLYNEEEKRWRLAPAYGLRFTDAPIGARMLSVNGNNMVPSAEDLTAVGRRAGLSTEFCGQIIGEIKTNVNEKLGKYL